MNARPVPWRITAALDARGLYGPEVDVACGVAEPVVDMWEAGTLVPTPEQVEALARLTGHTVAWFYLPEPPPLGPVWVCSRSAPKGKRCQVVDDRPAGDAAPVYGQGRLF